MVALSVIKSPGHYLVRDIIQHFGVTMRGKYLLQGDDGSFGHSTHPYFFSPFFLSKN